ncbi:MAG TPA: ArsI/CadI family heavy metal resistance metalloenzyme [Candidatus Eremiobacteraceae bacterium]|nr:ArsI/CadI family heavy metal resistance metalloenzyme [Candidatus Eremiobacteraceae bacterium]
MKTHMNFATRDLAKSVDFYKTLLDAQPLKSLDDYALFVTDDPGLELALDLNRKATPGHEHYGLVVDSTAEVDRAAARLSEAGLAIDLEREEVCCYAKQTKVWATDPDGRRWEVYTVLEETEQRDASDCCSDDCTTNEACCT